MPIQSNETDCKKRSVSSKLAAARWLIDHYPECNLFPVTPGQKTPPLFKDWPSRASRDPAKLQKWFGGPHPANIGIACGRVVVLDLDCKNGLDGVAVLDAMAKEAGEALPDGPVHSTPTGGKHRLYLVEGVKLSNSVGKLGLNVARRLGLAGPDGESSGIDVRSFGGYVVAPGSITNAGTYTVEHKAPLPDMPQWLIDAILAASAQAEPRKAPEGLELDTPAAIANTARYLALDAKPAIQGSGGDAQTYAVCAGARDFGISEAVALDLLLEHYNPRCIPPWEPEDMAVKVANAYAYSQNEIGAKSIEVEFGDLDAERDAELQLCNDLGLDVPAMIRTAAANAKARAEEEDGDAKSVTSRIHAAPFVWRDPATIPPRQWLFGNHYIRGFATGTVAPGGAGKTAMTLTEALSMATGRDLIGGNPRPAPLKVWIWNLEDPAEEVERRFAAAVQHHGIEPATLNGQLFVNSGRDTPLVIAKKVRETITVLEPVIDNLVAEIRANSIDVLIIDPFVSSHSLPENDNAAMDAAVKAWARVAHLGRCAVELVHHSRKLGREEASAESARGGSAFVDGCRGVRVINRMSNDEAARLGISEPRRFVCMADDKPNMTPPPAGKRDWFQLVSVQLPNGDNVGAVDKYTPPNPLDDVTPDHLARVQALFTGGAYRESDQSPEWGGYAVASVLDLDIGDKSGRTPEQNAARAKVKDILRKWMAAEVIGIDTRKDQNRVARRFYAASPATP
ncbi:AAA family ATPase [Mesorhizobium sp. PAMC28654]|uniref:AAA family ATPase n=1 Tax=Mesorhizobium sp. PAMC28654 TaxID=2880934 RepID=UPI001D0A0B74|nr:AAA family ATPase [Mesorhizobium sp. PAMC28654]UDL88114.1 AAA family ATPase [Mesorhizobium sp. PAMC28654]